MIHGKTIVEKMKEIIASKNQKINEMIMTSDKKEKENRDAKEQLEKLNRVVTNMHKELVTIKERHTT